ncbi:ABC transporter substrate-binding protein [Flagellimonas sp.]|uniref:ABC transporter substrate-binding protein n=1 Tax=Flagellimonas sp. TaxID=2058762 RepID=UPI003F4A34AC
MMRKSLFSLSYGLLLLLLIGSCKEKKSSSLVEQSGKEVSIKYAKGFSIEETSDFTVIKVISAWPGATNEFTYALIPREKLPSTTLPKDAYDAIVSVPVERMIVTSTTHIPALEELGVLHTMVGFPNTDLISSPKTRERIDSSFIKELGTNENINTEIALDLNTDVLVGFGINGTNKAYETLKLSGIPIVYNGDWTEQTPLGKAEWIKFFAPFYQKEKEADRIFKTIESSYTQAKQLAQNADSRPTVLTGGLYKDVWYVAGGNSWMSQFLKDANAEYLWQETDETGSIGLSLEEVLTKGKEAEFWFNPSLHSTYSEMESANSHYLEFDAYKNQNVFSNAIAKGETGGILFYELAPQRPDLVLKDLISILHPNLIDGYETHFFKPLQ